MPWRITCSLAVLITLAANDSASRKIAIADVTVATLDLESWKVDGRQKNRTSAKSGVIIAKDQNPIFFKNEPGADASGTFVRTITFHQTREIRVRFKMDQPPLAGMGVRLSAGKSHYSVLAAEEGRFVLSAQPPFYGGPGWHAGESCEIRISRSNGELSTSIVLGERLPVKIDRYTRPIPKAWQDADSMNLEIGFLSKQRPSRGDAAGTAQLQAVRLFTEKDEIPRDVEISSSPAETLNKFYQLSSGKLTPPLTRWIARQSETDPHAPLPERFEVQAWDGSKIGKLREWKESTMSDIARYYTLLQFRGSVPDSKLIAGMTRHDLRLASYQSTRQLAYYTALADSPHVLTQVLIKGKPQSRANRFSGDLVELAARQTLLALEPARESGILKRVMLDSEHKTGVGLDPLARAAAKQSGIDSMSLSPPAASGHYQKVVADDDPLWKSLHWYYRNHHTDNDFHRPIASAIHKAWPGVEVTTDPILDYGSTEQFATLDDIQHWIRVHYAPRNPLSVAYYCERARVHVRRGKEKPGIVIGPQLGRNERATPADMLSEACWLAVAFGARGITHWGQQAIWKPDGQFAPGGKAAWQRLRRLKKELYDPHSQLLLAWKPQPRRIAMLYSLADLAYGSGGRYTGREACENMYRSLLSLGEPVDVVYNEEVSADRLDQYQALIVPSLYVANRSLVDKIAAFVNRGGCVVAHQGSVLSDIQGVAILKTNLTPVYRDYAITKGEQTLLPHEYAEFLAGLSRSVRAELPFAPRVTLDRTDVIANLMQTDRESYLVLVNDRRTYGEEAIALGHKYMLDQGVSNRISLQLSGTLALKDISTGKVVKPNEEGQFETTLEPGWGAIFRIVKSPPAKD